VLFDDKTRTFQGPRSYIESLWKYVDRSARVETGRVRAFLNHWIAEYPEGSRGELISRFKAGDDRGFTSATFEVVLFALLRSTGWSITVHPDLKNGTGAHPDFLATSSQEESVYIEAVIASEFSKAEISARKRADVVLDAIERVNSPDFFLDVDAEGHPDRPPNGKCLRSALEKWLTSLDPDAVTELTAEKGSSELPSMKWEKKGWQITFRAIPKMPEERGKGQRVICALHEGGRFVNSWEPIRDAVKAKGNRYGDLDHPLIVAVNVDAIDVDEFDEMQGLFGEEAYVSGVGDPYPTEMRRKPTGAWYGPKGPQYTRVTATWLFRNLNVWNLATPANTLYFNPWAQRSIPKSFALFNHARAENDRMQWTAGHSLGQILGLPME